MIEEVIEFYNSNIREYPLFYAVYFSFVASVGYIVGGLKRQYIISTLYIVLFVILFNDITIKLPFLKSIYLYPLYAVFFLAGLNSRLSFISGLSLPSLNPLAPISDALRRVVARFRASRHANTRAKTEKRSQRQREAPRAKPNTKAKDKRTSSSSENHKHRAREEFRQAREDREQQQEEATAEKPQEKPARSPLDVLGLSASFTPAELEKAYKTLRARYHPDRFEHMSEALKAEMAEEFRAVQESYRKLK